MNAKAITLCASAAGEVAQQLTSGATSSSFGFQIDIQLSPVDLDEIKRKHSVMYSSTDNSFLSATTSLLTDMVGNPFKGIALSAALQASAFSSDTSKPVLERFDLDMDQELGVLTLYFAETADPTTLDVTGLTLQQKFNATLDAQHTLRQATVTTAENSANVTVILSRQDFDALKIKRIASTAQTVWLGVREGAINDTSGIGVAELVNGVNVIPCGNFTDDKIHPHIEHFDLNMNEGLSALMRGGG